MGIAWESHRNRIENEEHEESSKSEHVILDKKFTNIESEPFVIGQKVGYVTLFYLRGVLVRNMNFPSFDE